jgi:amidase
MADGEPAYGEPAWKRHCAEKRLARQALLPRDWLLSPADVPSDAVCDVKDVPGKSGKLSPKELDITEEDDADVLLAKVADRTWSALEVATAFCKRATLAHQLVTC